MNRQLAGRLATAFIALIGLQLVLLALFTTDIQAASIGGAITKEVTIGSGADSPFGLNVSAAARYGIAGQMQVPLDAARATGASWDREEFRWDMVYRNGSWNWGLTDEVVSKATARGLNLLVLLDYNIDGSHTMPDLNAWSGYVRQVVARYKNQVHYYEIWNEPENNTYLAGNNPDDYARLLTTSYNVIKSVDASAQVVTAGVNGFAVPWLEHVLAAGGEGHFDVIGVHPYVDVTNSPYSTDSRYWIDDQLAYWTAFAARHGNKPLWATEFGWNTNQVSEDEQANYLTRSYVQALSAGFKKLFVYVFSDPADNARYGIVRNWTNPKPAYSVYKNMVNQLNGATFQDRIDLADGSRFNIDDFESGTPWWSYAGGMNASTAIVSSPAHSSGKALKLDYQFGLQSYAEFGKFGLASSHMSVPLPGQPTKVGFWVYGDNNSTIFRILLSDATGQLLQYNVGKAGTNGWHRLEAYLPGPQADHSGSTTLNYPLSFKSIQIFRQPDPLEATFGGTIYLDDFYAESGSNTQDFRFSRNGKTLDVLWSDSGSGNVNLPTLSTTATAINRNGSGSTINANNGNFNLNLDGGLLFIEHQAPALSTPNPTPQPSTCNNTGSTVQSSNSFSNGSFQALWNRYDLYAPGNRSYVWGQMPSAAGSEPYAQTASGFRAVLYFDKSRMEITHPENNASGPGYVTNGLLTVELITGKMQTGDDQSNPSQFRQCSPARVPMAGDLDDTNGPTYATFAARLNDSPLGVGSSFVTQRIAADGSLHDEPGLASYGVRGGYYVPNTRHTIAQPFWDFLNNPTQKIYSNGGQQIGKLFDPWYEAPGLPISEAYWARVKVGGQIKDVLIQAFERRVLTYTPGNSAAFQVEWGNIGQHYYRWRYGS